MKLSSTYDFNSYFCKAKENEGFAIDSLTKYDLNLFREVITNHYRNVLSHNNATDNEKELPINKYNQTRLAKSNQHDKAWRKPNRTLPQESLQKLMKSDFFSALKNQVDWYMWGKTRISEKDGRTRYYFEENIGYPEVYFRLVRPSPYSDIGPLHCDAWFWELGNGEMPTLPFAVEKTKFWFSLYNQNNSTGFRYLSGSHKNKFNYIAEERDGFNKPFFEESLFQLDIEELNGVPGTFIVFNENLLHGGYTTEIDTRVSCEFTLILKQN